MCVWVHIGTPATTLRKGDDLRMFRKMSIKSEWAAKISGRELKIVLNSIWYSKIKVTTPAVYMLLCCLSVSELVCICVCVFDTDSYAVAFEFFVHIDGWWWWSVFRFRQNKDTHLHLHLHFSTFFLLLSPSALLCNSEVADEDSRHYNYWCVSGSSWHLEPLPRDYAIANSSNQQNPHHIEVLMTALPALESNESRPLCAFSYHKIAIVD